MEEKKIIIQDYTPDIIARNLKQVKEGVVEMKRYSDSGIRYLAWSWFLVVLGFWSYNLINKELIYNEILWAIDPTPIIKDIFNFYEDRNNLGYTASGESFKQFAESMLEMHNDRRYWGWFYMLFPVFLFFCVASPKWRPLRIDTKRRLVYFWLWGQFYITRYPKNPHPLSVLYSRMHQPKLRFPEHGALVLKVPHESQPDKFTEVDLGIFRPACKYQNYVLYNFLYDYLISDDPDKEFGHYFKKEHTLFSDYLNRFFYRFSLFPDRGYNEQKTESKIQAWLAKNPESDDHFSGFQSDFEHIIRKFLQ